MSASPLERVTPAIATPGRRESAPAAAGVRTSQRSFRPLFGVLTAFWIYVALSNLMYAISMQASLTVQNIHNVFAPWDARVIQHLLLYPLFILSMRGALRTGWQPLWRALPLQLLCALGFAVLAAPVLVLGEYLTGLGHGESAVMWHQSMEKDWGSWSGFMAHEVPIWLASITSFLVTYGFGLALVTGFTFYQRLRDSQLRSAALERALSREGGAEAPPRRVREPPLTLPEVYAREPMAAEASKSGAPPRPPPQK